MGKRILAFLIDHIIICFAFALLGMVEMFVKTDFELFLLRNYDFFLEKALQVKEELLEYDIEKEFKHTLEQGYVCHGDYQYHNLLKNDKKMAVINFEKCVRDNPVRDLYLFLRNFLFSLYSNFLSAANVHKKALY